MGRREGKERKVLLQNIPEGMRGVYLMAVSRGREEEGRKTKRRRKKKYKLEGTTMGTHVVRW